MSIIDLGIVFNRPVLSLRNGRSNLFYTRLALLLVRLVVNRFLICLKCLSSQLCHFFMPLKPSKVLENWVTSSSYYSIGIVVIRITDHLTISTTQTNIIQSFNLFISSRGKWTVDRWANPQIALL